MKNNPLSYTDPSGYFFKKLFRSIGKFFKKYGRTILAIAAGVFTAGAALAAYAGVSGLGFSATLGAITVQGGSAFLGAVVAGAAGGFASGLIATGSLRGAVEGAVFGGLSAGLAFGIGHEWSAFQGLGRTGKAVAHGVAQGTVSVLRGEKFGAGFASSFASHYFAPDMSKGTVTSRTVRQAVIGGTVSKAVGGKFANGAVSAAFTHLFNAEMDEYHQKRMESYVDPFELADHIDSILTSGNAVTDNATYGRKRYMYLKGFGWLDIKHAVTASTVPFYGGNFVGRLWERAQKLVWPPSAYRNEDIFSNHVGTAASAYSRRTGASVGTSVMFLIQNHSPYTPVDRNTATSLIWLK